MTIDHTDIAKDLLKTVQTGRKLLAAFKDDPAALAPLMIALLDGPGAAEKLESYDKVLAQIQANLEIDHSPHPHWVTAARKKEQDDLSEQAFDDAKKREELLRKHQLASPEPNGIIIETPNDEGAFKTRECPMCSGDDVRYAARGLSSPTCRGCAGGGIQYITPAGRILAYKGGPVMDIDESLAWTPE